MKKFDTLEQEVLEPKQGNELNDIIFHYIDMTLGSIEDVLFLHSDVAWALNILASDIKDPDKYKHLLNFNVFLTQVQHDYILLMNGKIEALENGSVVLTNKNKSI